MLPQLRVSILILQLKSNQHHRYKFHSSFRQKGKFPPFGGENSLSYRQHYTTSRLLRVLEELKGKSDSVVLVVILDMLLLISLAKALRSDLYVTPLSLYSNFLFASDGPHDFKGFTPSRNNYRMKQKIIIFKNHSFI